MAAQHRLSTFQQRFRNPILIVWALCSFILVAAIIQPVFADNPPTLQFSTYLGGSGNDYGENIALDKNGNIYVTGYTSSTDFPATNPFNIALPASNSGSYGMYVTKFDPTDATQLYSVFIGQGTPFDIAVDADGYAYVVGLGRNIPTVHAIQPTLRGTDDAFIAKINPSGTGLVYSTYLGGDSEDFALGVGLDADRNVYIAGVTMSTNFPTHDPYQATFSGGQWDVFVARLNAAGSALDYSTYYGGDDWDIATDIAVDSEGNAYITGDTQSTNFPTVSPYRGTLNTCVQPPHSSVDCADVYIAKFNASGIPVYSTYFGGTGVKDRGNAIAVDSTGSIYITGDTNSTDLPTTADAFQAAPGNTDSSFVAKFNADGSAPVYVTYLLTYLDNTGFFVYGGSGAQSIVVNADGQAFVTGVTNRADFPTVNPVQATLNGSTDIYISQLNENGSALMFSTYLGGSDEEGIQFSPQLTLDSDNSVYVTSTTFSDDFPTLHAFQPDPGGPFSPLDPYGYPGPPNVDAFVAKIGFRYVPHAEPSQSVARNYYTTDMPTLTWTPVTWATHYHVQVSKNKLFSGTPDFEGETDANGLSITTDALDDGVYYWRVQAQKADGDWGGWSLVESFTVYAN
ncbi:MAG: SBBP repeat-containing protein [Chloroflexota bacterium]